MSLDEKRSNESHSDKRYEHDKGRERDEEVKALLASDLSANFEWLMLIYEKKLKAFVRLSGNPLCAEDIVQETFINAYYALNRITAEQRLKIRIRPWLYRITRNVSLNYCTRYTKLRTISTDSPKVLDILEKTEKGQYPPPDKEIEQKEAYNELYRCIDRLPDKLRLPVLLHYIFELEYQEVAEVLLQPFNTVKSNGLRGFRKLRDMMREESLKTHGT
jgi:RNA polymerase sigma-70 factor (ECF subfamily)